jgi:hypothetical protein
MFKRYILLLLLPLVAACTKTDKLPDVLLPHTYHKVPYLVADTMIATTQAGSSFVYDTLYTATDSANCYIYYKGNTYKLKAYEEDGKTFSDSTGVYLCDVFDVNDAQLNATTAPIKVNSSKAYNTLYKMLEKRRQAIEIHIAPFPQDATAYLGRE